MLKLRLLTALILIPLVIYGVFYLPQSFYILFIAIIFGLAAWEWAHLGGWASPLLRLLYVILIFAASIGIGYFGMVGALMAMAIGSCWWLVVMIWILKIRNAPQLVLAPQWLRLLSGFLVLLPSLYAMMWLKREPALLFYMLLMIWSCDTGAYFGGRRWGKTKLAITLSPNKTLEGCRTGIITTLIASLILCWFFFTPSEFKLSWLLPVLPLIPAAIVGDLFESALKRMQNLKDSGSLLPGHGGVLDRLDSLVAVAPIFVCTTIYLRQAGY